MNRRLTISIALIALLVFAGGNLFAQEVPLLEQLQQRLQEQEWPEQQIQEMLQAARRLNWDETNPGSAEIVELALKLSLQEETRLKPDEQAQLALQIAIAAQQMHQAGMQERDIATACMECTREMLQEMTRLRTQDQTGDLGEQLQERIRNTIRNQIRIAAKEPIDKRGTNAKNGPQGPSAPVDGFPPDEAGKK